jgi:hypothetical protein
MKTVSLLLLLAASQLSFGQNATNVIAIGDWSAPVTHIFWSLRGRLLIYGAAEGQEHNWPHGRIYMELQNVRLAGGPPLEFYFDSDKSCLQFEMRDGHDKLIPLVHGAYWGPVPAPFTITLPPESTIRMPVDFENQSSTKPNGLVLSIGAGRYWTIWTDSTNDYYLSAAFSPSTNHPSALNYPIWQGTLQLPRVKIPVEKINKS